MAATSATTAKITEKVAEKSTHTWTVTFTDEDDAAVTPDSITWTLTDEDGAVINSRSAVAVSSPAASNDITLSGDDLAISDENKLERRLTIEAVIDLAAGNDKPVKGELTFYLQPLVAVS
jgi:hypothetical protein